MTRIYVHARARTPKLSGRYSLKIMSNSDVTAPMTLTPWFFLPWVLIRISRRMLSCVCVCICVAFGSCLILEMHISVYNRQFPLLLLKMYDDNKPANISVKIALFFDIMRKSFDTCSYFWSLKIFFFEPHVNRDCRAFWNCIILTMEFNWNEVRRSLRIQSVMS